MTARISATFPDGTGAREAQRKLQALRVLEVDGDGSTITATVEDEVLGRAVQVIEQTGGSMEL